ncbi:hypothetical protein F4680DRAFT_465192, partial [Xylaria scruposa]
ETCYVGITSLQRGTSRACSTPREQLLPPREYIYCKYPLPPSLSYLSILCLAPIQSIMSSPMPQEERENLARTISNIWGTLTSPNLTVLANTTPASTDTPSTTSDTSAPTVASSHTSDSPAGDASTTSDQRHIDVRHNSCQVKMSLNTDALAADMSRRDDRHEERIPCRDREAHERGPKVEQEGPNFVFGDAARQQRPHAPIQTHYANSSTSVSIRDINHRHVGLNIGQDGRGLGLNLSDLPVARTLLTMDANALVVILCMLLAAWLLRG